MHNAIKLIPINETHFVIIADWISYEPEYSASRCLIEWRKTLFPEISL